jgi:hypothetical protein
MLHEYNIEYKPLLKLVILWYQTYHQINIQWKHGDDCYMSANIYMLMLYILLLYVNNI